jgi:N-acetyl-gamma-glutamyl-phosphate reductase
VTITFVPHLVPMIRGILSVSYANAKKTISKESLFDIYKNFYSFHPFVRILENNLPNTKHVAGTNFIDISPQYDDRNKRVIVVAALDNLIKGASGQAVQNMNLIFGLNEVTGLKFKPIYP